MVLLPVIRFDTLYKMWKVLSVRCMAAYSFQIIFFSLRLCFRINC